MKKLIKVLCLSCLIVSCGQSDTKQKEYVGIRNEDTITNQKETVIEQKDTITHPIQYSEPQEWSTKNLDVSIFRNGDSIPEAKTANEWEQAGENGKPAWCYYANNEESNGKIYGKLYNWYAVNDPRGLAPAGWHIPSAAEWAALEKQIGDDAGTKMKSTSLWEYNSGTNSSGFSGLPGGMRDYNGFFMFLGSDGYWWSSSTYDDKYNAVSFHLNYEKKELIQSIKPRTEGYSVRCVKD